MAAKPFLFEQAFDSIDDETQNDANVADAPALFDEPALIAERDAAFALGFAQGEAQGRADATAAAEAAAERAREAIAAALSQAFSGEDDAAETALAAAPAAAARALQIAFPAFAKRHGAQEILAAIREALARASDEPRLVVRLAETDFDTIEPELARLTARAGFPGRIVSLEDANVDPGDVRIEWADGGLARDLGRLSQRLADALTGLAESTATQSSSNANPPQSASDHVNPGA